MIRRSAVACLALCSACATADDAQPVPVGRADTAVGVVPDSGAPDTKMAADVTVVVDSPSDVSPEIVVDTYVEDTYAEDSIVDSTGTDATDTAMPVADADADAHETDAALDASDAVSDASEPEADGETCVAPCPTPPYEVEPNNTLGTATPLWPSTSTWIGAIEPYGDYDYFTFTLTAPAVVELVTHNVAAPTLCSHDTSIHLFDATGLELTSDDDSGVGTCSHIKGIAPLPAGKYFVSVHEFEDNATISGCQLDLIIK